jgi:hypothetical protein
MCRAACLIFVIACGSKTEPVGPAGGSAAPPIDRGSGSAAGSGIGTYVGPAESGPCNDAHDCILRDECGCSCKGVLGSAPRAVECEESCPDNNICDGYTAICDLATHRCGAIPKSPK